MDRDEIRSGGEMSKLKIFLAAAALCAGAYFAASKIFQERNGAALVFSGSIEAHQIRAGSKVGGRVSEVLSQEGDFVKPGQVLVRFEAGDVFARKSQMAAALRQTEAQLLKLQRGFRPEEIAQAKAAVESAQAQLTLLKKGTRHEEIEIAQSELDSAQTEYDNALDTFHRVEKLYKTNDVPQQNYDDAKAKVDFLSAKKASLQKQVKLLKAGARPEEIQSAQKRVEEANARFTLLKRGNRFEDIEAAKAAVEQAKANISAVEVQIEELDVKSLTRAVVEVVDVRPGDLVPPGSTVATLLEADQLYVRVFVPETKLGFVQLKKKVFISVDSFPARKFAGVIEQIAAQSEFMPRNVQTLEERAHQVFMMKVKILEGADVLRAGMAADVIIP